MEEKAKRAIRKHTTLLYKIYSICTINFNNNNGSKVK